MIGYLCGETIEYSDGRALIGVGSRETAGCVGYSVSVPQRPSYEVHLQNKKAELYIYTHVREEALDLYGFSSQFEKELFLVLLSVNGVGPKSALGILSSVEPETLIDAITRADQVALTRLPGIGKKTAERVVVELKDTVRKKMETGWASQLGGASFHSSYNKKPTLPGGEPGVLGNQAFQDAQSALVSLGYREQDIQILLQRLVQSQDATQPRGVEDLVRAALRQLA